MFLARRKPTSPALRWEATTTNKFFRRFRGKKFLPVRSYRGFVDKKIRRKSTTKPSTKHYKLYDYLPLTTNNSSILSMHKSTGVTYLIACIDAGYGGKYYIKASAGMLVGFSTPQVKYPPHGTTPFLIGTKMCLGGVPTGGTCYSLRILGKLKWSLAESAGTFCKILWHELETGNTAMNLPSKKFIKLGTRSVCNAGRVSNQFHKYTVFGNARNSRTKKGKHVSVRGVAMNPVDHPNGGRSNTKQPLRNPWGRIAKKNK